jgi:penicillin-binding protein 2
MIGASRHRLIVIYITAAAMLITLAGRLWYLQVMNGASFSALAQQSQTRDIVVPAVRGQILDDTGRALVRYQTSLVVSVNMMQLSQQGDGGAAVLKRLASLLGTSVAALRQQVRLCTAGVRPPCWSGSPYQPIPVANHVSDQVALQIMEEQKLFPGVQAQVQPVTVYPDPAGANPVQALGYLQPITAAEIKARHLTVTGFSGVDLVGQSGLEAEYDQELRGSPGNQVVSVNAAGDVRQVVATTPAHPGDDLVISLNAQAQSVVQQVLANAVAKERAQGKNVNQGAAIVETTTGRIVAMASYPDYNADVWQNGITEQEFKYLFGNSSGAPVINYATQGQYAPGSTFKVISTSAAVANGYPLNGLYSCPASVSIGGHNFINDGEPGQGLMTLRQALIKSCDTVYYDFGYQMWQRDNLRADALRNPNAPVQKMQAMELAWGFGKNTGIDLPEQSPGTIPTRQWLYWLWKDNAYTGQDWCKNGREHGSYVQQIE